MYRPVDKSPYLFLMWPAKPKESPTPVREPLYVFMKYYLRFYLGIVVFVIPGTRITVKQLTNLTGGPFHSRYQFSKSTLWYSRKLNFNPAIKLLNLLYDILANFSSLAPTHLHQHTRTNTLAPTHLVLDWISLFMCKKKKKRQESNPWCHAC